eukprot:gene2753-4161_t
MSKKPVATSNKLKFILDKLKQHPDDPTLLCLIGTSLFYGLGCQKNIEKAKQYLSKSSNRAFTPSISLLARIYYSEGNVKKALELYYQGLTTTTFVTYNKETFEEDKQRQQEAKYDCHLGYLKILLDTNKTKNNYNLFLQASKFPSPYDKEGLSYLGSYFAFEKEYKKAHVVWKLGSQKNFLLSCIGMAKLYTNGDGVNENLKIAKEYCEKALKLDPESDEATGIMDAIRSREFREQLDENIIEKITNEYLYSCNCCDKKEDVDVKFLVCSRCKSTRYCSNSCQKNDWSKHKLNCVAPQKKINVDGYKFEMIMDSEYQKLKISVFSKDDEEFTYISPLCNTQVSVERKDLAWIKSKFEPQLSYNIEHNLDTIICLFCNQECRQGSLFIKTKVYNGKRSMVCGIPHVCHNSCAQLFFQKYDVKDLFDSKEKPSDYQTCFKRYIRECCQLERLAGKFYDEKYDKIENEHSKKESQKGFSFSTDFAHFTIK